MLFETPEQRDERMMRLALCEAAKAAMEGEVPIGAVVACGDRVLAKAHNQTEALTDVTAHAEMLAITAAATALGGKYLPQCTLYVTVEPCPMCAGALAWSQIGRIVWGATDAKRGFRSICGEEKMLHPRTTVTTGVLADEATALMREFFRRKRRK